MDPLDELLNVYPYGGALPTSPFNGFLTKNLRFQKIKEDLFPFGRERVQSELCKLCTEAREKWFANLSASNCNELYEFSPEYKKRTERLEFNRARGVITDHELLNKLLEVSCSYLLADEQIVAILDIPPKSIWLNFVEPLRLIQSSSCRDRSVYYSDEGSENQFSHRYLVHIADLLLQRIQNRPLV